MANNIAESPFFTRQKQKKNNGLNGVAIFLTISLGMFGIWAATQAAAKALQYHPNLGAGLFAFHGMTFYPPWELFVWTLKFGNTASMETAWRAGAKWLLIDMFLFVPAFVFSIALSRSNKIEDTHGSAKWATFEDVEKTGLIQDNPSGCYVGGFLHKNDVLYLTHNGPEHIFVFAPTRSGKGVGVVIPTLLSWQESVVVYDIKGENYAVTGGWRQSIGQKVFCFNPANPDSCRFNPLEEVIPFLSMDTEGEEVSMAQNIAIMVVDPDGKGLQDHWAKTGHAFLVGAILHVLYVGENKSLGGVAELLSNPSMTFVQTLELMIRTKHLSCGKPHKVVSESARDMLNKSDNERSGVLSTAMSFLTIYRDPIVARNTQQSDFKIEELMRGESPASLYIVAPPSDKDRLKPLIRLLISQIVRQNTKTMAFENGQAVARYKHRLLLLIDEFPSLGKIEVIEESLAFTAGYGIKALLVAQDISQLRKAYGNDESITGGCHIRMVYAPNKVETAEYIAKMCGETTVISQRVNYSGGRMRPVLMQSQTFDQEVKRQLLTADEVMRLPGPKKEGEKIVEAGDMLIFVAGFPPIYGRQILYFIDPVFSARAKIPPPTVERRTSISQPAGTNQHALETANLSLGDVDC